LKRLNISFPDNYDIRLYKGIVLLIKKNYEAAYEELHKIENSLEAKKRIGGPLGALRDRDIALTMLANKKEDFSFSSKNKGLLYFAIGITLITHKADFGAAIAKFNSALKEGYDDISLRYFLIYSYLKLKRYQKANQELSRLLERKEIDEMDYFIKGYLDYLRGMENEAVYSFKKALEINPNLVEAKKNLASIFYNKGEWETAIGIWETIPDDVESKLNIGRAYFHLGRLDEARKQFEIPNISIPIKEYSPKKISLVFIPIENWFKFNIGYHFDYQVLLKYGVDMEKLKRSGIKPSMLKAILNEKALFVLRTEGKIEEAIRILEFANNIEKGSFFISYNLGQLYLSMGNLEKAKEFAIRAIQYKENFLEAHDLLGNIYFKEGKYQNALEEFKRCVEISKSDAQGYFNLGCSYWALSDLEKAEEAWKNAVKFDLQMERKEEEKFVQDGLTVSLIIRKTPISYRAHISLASLYERKNLIGEAIKEYQEAVKIEPNNPEAYFELGRIYFDSKDLEKARFYLEKHISLGGKNQERAKKLLDSLKF